MRVIGLDIHRVFAEAVLLENGAARRLGRIGMTRDCPSSDDLRRLEALRNGGSGPPWVRS
jgi:hypothetical protein